MLFKHKPFATIKAKLTTGSTININGVTSGDIEDTVATAQINKILTLVGKEIITAGMVRVQTEEASE